MVMVSQVASKSQSQSQASTGIGLEYCTKAKKKAQITKNISPEVTIVDFHR